MALPPQKISGYVPISGLEEYIDNCLKNGKYNNIGVYFYIDCPFNLSVKDFDVKTLDKLKKKYVAAGWANFTIQENLYENTPWVFRLDM